MQGSVDIEEETEKLGRKEPYILLSESDETTKYHIIVENTCMVTTHTLPDALVNIICTYFIFDMAYPKQMYPLLIFLQHFVFNLKDRQKVPTSVTALCSSISVE